MMGNLWRLLTLPCILLALLLLVGSPGFPALDRALSTAFSPAVPSSGESSVWSGPASSSLWGPASAGRPIAVADPSASADASAFVEADSQVGLAEEPLGADPVPPGSNGRRAIVPLYVSFAALQALDIHSTLIALNRGGTHEANPLMAGVVEQPAALVALKAATGAGIIYLTERVRKHSRAGALVMMAAFNSLYATIVANNYRVASR